MQQAAEQMQQAAQMGIPGLQAGAWALQMAANHPGFQVHQGPYTPMERQFRGPGNAARNGRIQIRVNHPSGRLRVRVDRQRHSQREEFWQREEEMWRQEEEARRRQQERDALQQEVDRGQRDPQLPQREEAARRRQQQRWGRTRRGAPQQAPNQEETRRGSRSWFARLGCGMGPARSSNAPRPPASSASSDELEMPRPAPPNSPPPAYSVYDPMLR